VVAGAGRCRIEVLGPLRVLDADGREVTPSGTLQRKLLALLVLRRSRVVSVDAAADVLWLAGPPADPAAAAQSHVFRLRRALPPGLIDSVSGGYRLDPGAVDIDADHMTAAVNDEAAVGEARAQIDSALARWRGPTYPELDELDDARAEALRLEELRTRLREARPRLALQPRTPMAWWPSWAPSSPTSRSASGRVPC
jgi:DNA-binding SARP family transcriptional activator